jgi:hypothetical protein
MLKLLKWDVRDELILGLQWRNCPAPAEDHVKPPPLNLCYFCTCHLYNVTFITLSREL